MLALGAALSSSPVAAGPVLDLGLEFLGVTTQVSGDPSGNYVTIPAAAGDVGRSFSGSAQSLSGAVAIVTGFGPYMSTSNASSVYWDALFRVNQYGIKVEILLGMLAQGQSASSGWADASETSSATLAVNGVTYLSGSQTSACNTYVLDCEDARATPGGASLILENLVFHQLIHVTGYLSTYASAEAGPACGSPLSTRTCVGVGVGGSAGNFTISAIREPSSVLMFVTGLLPIVLAARRPYPSRRYSARGR